MEKDRKNKGAEEKVTPEALDKLVFDVIQLFIAKKITIATAESCTGGLISELITSVPGASKIFEIGVCTYSNKIKHEYLGVPKALFKEYGAVSRQVALAMVAGLQQRTGADICVSITGSAGPGGGTPEKPVGTVYVGISSGKKRIVKLLRLWELEDTSRDSILMNIAWRVFKFLGVMARAMPSDLPRGRDDEPKAKAVAKNLLPWKGDTAAQAVRKSVFLLSVIIFTVCLFFVADYYWDNYKHKKESENIQQIYSEAAFPAVTSGASSDGQSSKDEWVMLEGAKKLLEINEDIVGYISIPGTDISYPVVQRPEDGNNDYYLTHDINKEEARAGAIFLDYRNYFDYVVDGAKIYDNSQNLVIYGHEMKDESMFAQLIEYKNKDGFYSEHPVVDLNSNYRNYRYKIFAYFIVDADDESDTKFDCWNKLNFKDEKDFYDFVNQACRRSLIISNVDVEYGDQILTLQTCNTALFESARLFVMARLVRPGEDAYEGTADAKENKEPLMPNKYYDVYGGSYKEGNEPESYPLNKDKKEEN